MPKKESILKRHFKQMLKSSSSNNNNGSTADMGSGPTSQKKKKRKHNNSSDTDMKTLSEAQKEKQLSEEENYDEEYNHDDEIGDEYNEEYENDENYDQEYEENHDDDMHEENASWSTTSPQDNISSNSSKNKENSNSKSVTEPTRIQHAILPPKPKPLHRIDLGKKWSALNNPPIHSELLSIIHDDFKFTHMSPVQENTIPLLLNNKDVVVQALTGSGKTLAFVIPIFQYILTRQFEGKVPTEEEMATRRKNVYSIVLLPTRELARQVYDVANKFASKTNLIVKLFIGGEERETLQPASEFSQSSTDKISKLESSFLDCNIAIGTPGRMLDYLKSKLLKVKLLEILIIDEADIILNMGFRQQVDDILSHLPKQRRTGLFSATQTSELDDLVRSGLRNPMKVTAVETHESSGSDKKKATVPSQLTNFYMYCDYRQKLNYLIHLLKNDDPIPSGNSIIVYFLTCACVDFYSKLFREILGKKDLQSIQLFSLHGQMVQKRRNAEHQSFKTACEEISKQHESNISNETSNESSNTTTNVSNSKKAVLFCTDVAARGLDFPSISTIIQFDAPTNPDQFVHRVGRTARMGKEGQSILFLARFENDYIDYLEFKKIHMHELVASQNMISHNYTNKETLKNIILSDRDIFEKGEEALKSFVRSYKEHQLTYIFKFDKLRFDQLLEAYCVLKRPTIREIKQQMEKIVLPFAKDIADPDTIPYKDVRREKSRLERLKKQEENKQLLEERKKEQLKEQKEQKKNSVNYLKDKVRNRSDLSSREKKQIYNRIENHEFNEEAMLLKRLKRKEISEEEYEELTGESKMEEEILKKLSERKRKQLQTQFKKK
ncbi:hypothetical protein C9374_002464 [Naegleria lovaniensis]|uniref:ATP-dependent RNA helicase n=1 Tax=Naegleria lovaniensis TaxID=51637 RepID=A0AA88GPU5_NAELO|nr:uncharacterized protein C9374_002464 [Naegleria lovaniensis]KAG2386720.1 hypothetical protein C9374_002464 [Naegleria lovaniensis]